MTSALLNSLCFSLMLMSSGKSLAQALAPKQREALIVSGEVMVGAKDVAKRFDGNVIDPFQGKAVVPPPSIAEEVKTVVEDKPQLVERLAQQIRASGTVVFDGQRFLLIGSKKFKVGDQFIINIGGESFEVFFTEINSTNFTINHQGYSQTRTIKR